MGGVTRGQITRWAFSKSNISVSQADGNAAADFLAVGVCPNAREGLGQRRLAVVYVPDHAYVHNSLSHTYRCKLVARL